MSTKKKDRQARALLAMADAGLIRPAARKGAMPAPRWRPAKVTGVPISGTIIDNRADRA
jgi:hypothetical protein